MKDDKFEEQVAFWRKLLDEKLTPSTYRFTAAEKKLDLFQEFAEQIDDDKEVQKRWVDVFRTYFAGSDFVCAIYKEKAKLYDDFARAIVTVKEKVHQERNSSGITKAESSKTNITEVKE